MMFVEMKSEEMTWKYPKYSVKVWMACRMNLSAGMDKTSNNLMQQKQKKNNLPSATFPVVVL